MSQKPSTEQNKRRKSREGFQSNKMHFSRKRKRDEPFDPDIIALLNSRIESEETGSEEGKVKHVGEAMWKKLKSRDGDDDNVPFREYKRRRLNDNDNDKKPSWHRHMVKVPLDKYPYLGIAIIGRGGRTIQALREEVDAFLHFENGKRPIDAHVVIKARSLAAMEKAKKLVESFIPREEDINEQDNDGESQGRLSGERVLVELPLKKYPNIARMFLGRALTDIREQSGAEVELHSNIAAQCAHVFINGKSEESVAKAKQMTEEISLHLQELCEKRHHAKGKDARGRNTRDHNARKQNTDSQVAKTNADSYVTTFTKQVLSRTEKSISTRAQRTQSMTETNLDLQELAKMTSSDDIFITRGFEQSESANYIDLFNQLISLTLPQNQKQRLKSVRMQQLEKHSNTFADMVIEKISTLCHTFEQLAQKDNSNSLNQDLSNKIKERLARILLFWGGENLHELSESYYHDLQHEKLESLTSDHLWTIVSELGIRSSNEESAPKTQPKHLPPNSGLRNPHLQKLSMMESVMSGVLTESFQQLTNSAHHRPCEPGSLQRAFDRLVERSYHGLDNKTEALIFNDFHKQ